ncbi:LrgB family protein, partial [Bacillus sp. WP8]|uniref:LrgB family protein n=1 Tax=Bacillus sp. WP8 TaxID=756828 RepID=UPI0028CB1C93
MLIVNIPYNTYNQPDKSLTNILQPPTLAFPIPLYNYFHILNNHPLQILFNLPSPSIIPILSTPFIPNLFHLHTPLIHTLVPTSLTTPLP